MTEASLQKTVVRYLRAALAPMGGVVGVIPNNPQARRTVGFTAGDPDIFIILRGRAYGLELKTAKGTVGKHQEARHDQWRRAGAEVFIVRSLEDAEGIVAALGFRRVL